MGLIKARPKTVAAALRLLDGSMGRPVANVTVKGVLASTLHGSTYLTGIRNTRLVPFGDGGATYRAVLDTERALQLNATWMVPSDARRITGTLYRSAADAQAMIAPLI